MKETEEKKNHYKPDISGENFIFPLVFGALLGGFAWKMGVANMLNTMMNTAYSLLMETVFYIMAVCVLMGAISALMSEFGFVTLMDKLLYPLMKPVFGLPGAASLGIVTTFLSDNPAILALAEDDYFKHYFKVYQFPALTNLGTSFGMGLIVCTYMVSLSGVTGESYGFAVAMGLLGAVIGSVVSTRLMLVFTRKYYGAGGEEYMAAGGASSIPYRMRPVRSGNVGLRAMSALLEGGQDGVKMGLGVIPGVLIVCTLVMMLINGPSESGVYTGAAYEGIRLLPALAQKCHVVLDLLFGFSSAEAVGVPITALGAGGAAMGMVASLLTKGLANAGDVAVFTAMCMCWSGYLSTHASMMDALNCKKLISKAILSHTIGGLVAGAAAHWLYILFSALL